MYPLQAFPTVSVIKDFIPYRGIILSCDIDLTEEEADLLSDNYDNNESHEVFVDFNPFLQRIAKEWNYDLSLLKEGKGETGQDDDIWTSYSKQEESSRIIRWKIKSAEIVIVIGPYMDHLQLIAIGNQAADPILNKLNDLFFDFSRRYDSKEEINVQEDNQLVQRIFKTQKIDHHFNTDCKIVMSASNVLNARRAQDYKRLLNSCNLTLSNVSPYELNNSSFTHSLLCVEIPDLRFKAIFQPDEEVTEGVYRLIYNKSIERARKFMDYMINKSLDKNFNSDEGLEPSTQTLEDSERTYCWKDQCRLLSCVPYYSGRSLRRLFSERTYKKYRYSEHDLVSFWKDISLGYKFIHPGYLTLRGTGKNSKRYNLHVSYPLADLLENIVQELIAMNKVSIEEWTVDKNSNKDLKFKANIVPAKTEEDADNIGGFGKFKPEKGLQQGQILDLEKPYYSVHHGMPIRVEKFIAVWHNEDTHAIACDIWYDLESRHLHVAKLYRIKLPKL